MPDMMRYLGGSEVGFEIPGLGTFYPPNLTPDPETGLGNWSEEQIVSGDHNRSASRRANARAGDAVDAPTRTSRRKTRPRSRPTSRA